MKLRDFIKETLVEIAYGVQEAKFAAKDIVAIAPGAMYGKKIPEGSYVDFDVAVTVTERASTGREGTSGIKAEIEVLGAKLGGEVGGGIEKTNEAATQTVSRIAFRVPVHMNAHFRGDQRIVEEERHFVTLNQFTTE